MLVNNYMSKFLVTVFIFHTAKVGGKSGVIIINIYKRLDYFTNLV
jgi:hypothetical protein